jgi:hypothetical protein
MVADISKVQLFLETIVRVADPARGGNNFCRGFGGMVYDEVGGTYYGAAQEALAEIAKLNTDAIEIDTNSEFGHKPPGERSGPPGRPRNPR